VYLRLRSDAPWKVVTLLNGTLIYRKNWTQVPDDTDYIAFKKYMEVKETMLESSAEATTINYSNLTKSQLIAIATEKNIDVSNLTKAKIIEVLNETN